MVSSSISSPKSVSQTVFNTVYMFQRLKIVKYMDKNASLIVVTENDELWIQGRAASFKIANNR